MNAFKRNLVAAIGVSILVSGSAFAADVTTAAPTTPAAAPSAAKKDSLRYQVVACDGKASVAAIGADPASDAGWRAIKVGEYLSAGQQVRTGARQVVQLVAVPSDPPTVIQIEKMSHVQISDLEFRNGDQGKEAYSRMQIGYGAVRAGVAEGATRSNMEIASPGATLSKKGTDIFRFWYYNQNDWGMSLSDRGRGLIQAIQNRQNFGITGGGLPGSNSRFVRPGQSVNQEMLRTIETEIFNRFVNVNDLYGLTNGDIKLISLWGNGLNIRGLNGNIIQLRDVTGTDGDMDGVNPIKSMFSTGVNNGTTLQLQQAIDRIRINQRRNPHGNNAGDFGIGQGTVPVNVFNNAAKAAQTLTRINQAAQKSAWMKSGGMGLNRK